MKSPLKRHASILFCVMLLSAAIAPAAFAQTGSVLDQPAMTHQLTQGWFQGRQTFYYDFGSNSAASADGSMVEAEPIFAFATGMDANGNPQLVPGQRNVIDVVPGDPGYSDLWHVNLVMVPSDYVANTIKSADDVRKSGYQVKEVNMLVDCPVVSPGSTLAEPASGSNSTATTKGWYKGRDVEYFDFGASPQFTVPIFAFATGMDASGNPQLVPGQHNVIDVLPGSQGYSPFWDVNLVIVPSGYQANSITSAAQVKQSGYQVLHPGKVVNCPVVRTDQIVSGNLSPVSAGAGASGSMPGGGQMSGTGATAPGMPHTGGGNPQAVILWLALAATLLASGLTVQHLRRARSKHRAR